MGEDDDDCGLDLGPEVERAARLLPTWFVPRMMTDEWNFAFLMVTGDIVHLTHIECVHLGADGIWLDVCLSGSCGLLSRGARDFCAPTSRKMASINTRHIVLAFETADT